MRDKIKLESSAGTGHFYTTTKNKRTMPGKLEIKKFDPVARKHVIYKETKLKYSGFWKMEKPLSDRGFFIWNLICSKLLWKIYKRSSEKHFRRPFDVFKRISRSVVW